MKINTPVVPAVPADSCLRRSLIIIMFSKTDTTAHQSHLRNVGRNVRQHVLDVSFEQLVVSQIALQLLTVLNEFQRRHEIGELFDERVSNLLVGFVKLLREIIFVNFFQGFVGSLFDVLCCVFDLSFDDQS